MLTYWPPNTYKPKSTARVKNFLWEHEYNVHGKDYGEILLSWDSDKFSGSTQNQQIQTTYFQNVIDLYKQFKVQKIPKDEYSKAQFGTLLGLKTNMFYPVCNTDGSLLELRICISMLPSGMKAMKCSRMSSRNCISNYRIILNGWE